MARDTELYPCAVCGDQTEGRDLEQARESHDLLATDGHTLRVTVGLTAKAEHLSWLADLLRATHKVAATEPESTASAELLAQLLRELPNA